MDLLAFDPEHASAAETVTAQTALGVRPDGDFGPRSRAALNAVRAAHGLSALVPSLMVNGAFTGILDLDHDNPFDLPALIAAGFEAFIHKASEGTTVPDREFKARIAAVRAAGKLGGAYHFASGEDGAAQARHFLAQIDPEDLADPGFLLCLDFEPSNDGPNMTLAQCHAFVETVHAATNRWPVIYGGGGLLRDLTEGTRYPILAHCRLWLCDIRRHPQVIAPTWSRWFLLQYCGDGQGQPPMDTAGCTGADRNSFPGTRAELRVAWTTAAA